MSEPLQPPSKTYHDTKWTLWDRFIVEGRKEGDTEMTVQELFDHFKNEYQLSITMLSQGVALLYSFFMNKDNMRTRMAMSVSKVVEVVSKKNIPDHVKDLVLEVCCDDKNGEDVEVPFIQYRFR